jgi:hypothetical protein
VSAPPRSRLEERYRRVLRLLPASYRLAWEDEMVATFLASMEHAKAGPTGLRSDPAQGNDDAEQAAYLADFGRPSWSEVASVVALAVRLRVATAGAPPRYLAWGAALRVVALIGLLVHGATGVASLGIRLWATGHLPLLPASPSGWPEGFPTDLWSVALDVFGLVWLAAFLALVFGHRRVARVLAAAGLLVSTVDALASTVDLHRRALEPFVATRWTSLLISAALVLALVAFHSDSPAPARRPWLVALPIGAAVTVALQFLLPIAAWAWVDWPALCAAALITTALVHLAVPARRHVFAWTHALALLGGAVLVQRLVTLVDFATARPATDQLTALLLGIAEAGVVLVVLVPLWHRTRHTLHELAPSW